MVCAHAAVPFTTTERGFIRAETMSYEDLVGKGN
jgi:hypothetical protein